MDIGQQGPTPQSLIQRAWALHGGINNEFQHYNNRHGTVRFCAKLDRCRYCCIEEIEALERESLVAIRGSLKEVAESLMLLQRVPSWHLSYRQEALTKLNKSRSILKETAKQYKGKPLKVLEDLNAVFNIEKRRTGIRVLGCFKIMKWQKVVWIAAKLPLAAASISVIHFSGNNKHHHQNIAL